MTILNEAKKAKEDEAQQGYLLGASAVCDLSSVAKLSKQTSSEAESKKDSIEKAEAEEEDDEYDEFSEGLTSNQKCALGFIWFVSGIYSCMSQQILSKERDVHCNIRSDLTDKFNLISLFIAIGKYVRRIVVHEKGTRNLKTRRGLDFDLIHELETLHSACW